MVEYEEKWRYAASYQYLHHITNLQVIFISCWDDSWSLSERNLNYGTLEYSLMDLEEEVAETGDVGGGWQ